MHPKPEITENKQKTIRWLTDAIFYLAILFFIIGFNFSDRMAGNWYQQFMPNPAGGQVRDIYFIDSLLGFAVTDSSIIKTVNGGDNWSVKQTGYYIFNRIKFLNANTGFASGGNNTLLKTTNSGENWNPIILPNIYPFDMSVVSEDSIWLVNTNGLTGGVYRTTNGGASWTNQLNLGSQNPNHIYMFNGRIGFICEDNVYLRKTTNSGENWQLVTGAGGFTDIYFADSLTGWKTSFQKTTDGGLNWVNQTLPQGGNIITSQIVKFMNLGSDTIWGVGGHIFLPGQGNRGMIYRTINSGNNWLFQIPDTSINIGVYRYIDFYNKSIGWAYSTGPGIHTTSGGDPIWYIGIQQISSNVPKEYELKQNYPNPFNPRTVIPFSLKRSAYVKLIAYDITGREIQKMVEGKYGAGEYEADFMGKFTASGIYFYRMEVTDDRSKKVFSETKKMVLLK